MAKTNRTPKKESAKKGKLQKIGALWIGEGKSGKFMSGRISIDDENEIRVLVFKNNYKEEDKHPDYNIYDANSGEEQESREQAADDFLA